MVLAPSILGGDGGSVAAIASRPSALVSHWHVLFDLATALQNALDKGQPGVKATSVDRQC